MDSKEEYKRLVRIVKQWRSNRQESARNEDIALILGYNRSYFSTLLGTTGHVTEEHIKNLKLHFSHVFDNQTDENGSNLNELKEQPYFELRGRKKLLSDSDNDGILYVPVAAQAGYSTRFLDPVYLNQLEKVHLPGFPYRGNRYRVFDVKGDSMEPTYKEGYHLVCEVVDQESWHQIPNFYVYVIVLQSDIMVKRLFRKDAQHFVAISDNEEFHSQFIIPVHDVKELWQVKRKIDWEMAPPKKFEIKV